jgi:hypothetical protein
MARPFTDIQKINNSLPIKNFSTTITTTSAGSYQTLNTYTKNTPDLTAIASKYGNRFYNGIFVQLIGDQTIIGA